ncbi:MAG: tetraacyldisaccharide 4'-kinase [Gammaproteobacteria bacterium]|nr:tetraacyldisaccharide 4'-kinase [Gammaproteobacteria bacterium]|tara:strand:+ start:3362 stop:4387 length:1026 start_codon:yes stop_codon:yes gene_type:complete
MNLFINNLLNGLWFHNQNKLLLVFLLPISFLYFISIITVKLLYRLGILKRYVSKLPIIIIGNITVGGNGKTPITIWLTKYITEKYKIRVGVVSSGYNSQTTSPVLVNSNSTTKEVGDEAIELYQALSNIAIIISGGNRIDATKKLEELNKCDLIIHDDGMQHYRLKSNLTIETNSKNSNEVMNLILPAGPYRDFNIGSFLEMHKNYITVSFNQNDNKNIYSFSYDLLIWDSKTNNVIELEKIIKLSENSINLITSVANSERIFNMLKKYFTTINHRSFPDHYRYNDEDVNFKNKNLVITTMKDYVKLSELTDNQLYVLSNKVTPNNEFINCLEKHLKEFLI